LPNHIHRVNEIFFIFKNKFSLFFENELSVVGLRALPRPAWFSAEVLLVDNATCFLNKFSKRSLVSCVLDAIEVVLVCIRPRERDDHRGVERIQRHQRVHVVAFVGDGRHGRVVFDNAPGTRFFEAFKHRRV
jgi:hypothetical protein